MDFPADQLRKVAAKTRKMHSPLCLPTQTGEGDRNMELSFYNNHTECCFESVHKKVFLAKKNGCSYQDKF